jgi:hypothetical protein
MQQLHEMTNLNPQVSLKVNLNELSQNIFLSLKWQWAI